MSENRVGSSEGICGVVLAGGKSRRMGENKALIPFKGKALILHATDVLSALFSEVVIICDARSYSEKTYAHLPFRIFCDQRADLGPIGGIETALRCLPGRGLFVVAADMPFLKVAVIKEMLSYAGNYDCVIPRLEGRLHPLHTFYAPECLGPITAAIHSKQLVLHRLGSRIQTYVFPEACFLKFDPTLRSTFNINTPENLEEACRLAEKKPNKSPEI